MNIRTNKSQVNFAWTRTRVFIVGAVVASMMLLGFAPPAHSATSWDWFGIPQGGAVAIQNSNRSLWAISPTCAPRLLATQANGTTVALSLNTTPQDFYGARGCYTTPAIAFDPYSVVKYEFSSASGETSAQFIPPISVSNVRSVAGDRNITISWDKPENADFISYYYYYLRDGMNGSVVSSGQIDRASVSTVIRTSKNSEDFYFQLIPISYIGHGVEQGLRVVANTLPQAPARVKIIPGDKQLQIMFDPAISDIAAVTGYNVQIEPGNIQMTVPVTQRNFAVSSGITNNTKYQVSVAAANSIGQSPWTDSNVGTTRALPQPVTNVKANATGTSGATVTWSASPSDVTGYKVRSISTGETIDVGPTTTSALFADLLTNSARKSTYDFSVTAINDYLSSSAISTSTNFIPNAPTGVVVTGGFKSLTIEWSEPSDTQTPILGYVVDLLGSNGTVIQQIRTQSNETELVIANLSVDERIRVRVSTITAWGTSTPSAQSNVGVIQGTPGAANYATVNQIASSIGTVDVSLGSIETHGCSLTSWNIHAAWEGSSQDATIPARNTTYRMTDLPVGLPIAFTITPTNCWGDGPSYTLVKELSAVPEPVTDVHAFVNNTDDLEVTWTPSISTNVTSIAVTLLPGNQTINVGAKTKRAIFADVQFGKTYRASITTKSAAGFGSTVLSDEVLIATTPARVQDLGVTMDTSSNTAHITWSAPQYSGAEVTSYTVWVDSEPEQVTTETSVDITGLVPGEQHTFSVVATNALGDGATSSISFGIPAPVVVDPDGSGTVVIWAMPNTLRTVKSVVIQQKTGTSAWRSIATVTAKKGKYAIKKSGANTKYRVRAVVSKKKSVTLKIKLVRK